MSIFRNNVSSPAHLDILLVGPSSAPMVAKWADRCHQYLALGACKSHHSLNNHLIFSSRERVSALAPNLAHHASNTCIFRKCLSLIISQPLTATLRMNTNENTRTKYGDMVSLSAIPGPLNPGQGWAEPLCMAQAAGMGRWQAQV